MSSLWTPGGEHPVRPGQPPAGAGPAQGDGPPRETRPSAPGGEPPGGYGDDPADIDEATARARMQALEEELARTPAAVVVANHAYGLFELAALHLTRQPPQLDEAQLAIDALGAVVDGLAGRLGEAEATLREALAQLRLTFVQLRATFGGGATPPANDEGAATE
jgi:hypothetical protein